MPNTDTPKGQEKRVQQRWKDIFKKANEAAKTPEYEEYKRKVVAIGVERLGAAYRTMWESWSYELEFVEGETPEHCVTANIEAM